MASTKPTEKEVIRTILRLNGGFIRGKTVLQKLAYFAATRNEIEFHFEPHFYGPFSRDLDLATSLLALSSELEETTTSLGIGSTGWPIRQSTFRLTESGDKQADIDVAANPKFAGDVEYLLDLVKAEDPSLSPGPISVAAKVHFVLASQGEPLTDEQVRTATKSLGWDLSGADIKKAVSMLESLDLIEQDD